MSPLLPILLYMILGQSLGEVFQWTERDKVEIIIKFKDYARMSKTGNIGKLLGDYGNKYGLHWDEMDVTEGERCKNETGLERYQAYIMDCNEFQKYLYSLKPRRYNIEMVHVICDRIAATICMARSCSPSEYKKMAIDSYDCVHREEGTGGGSGGYPYYLTTRPYWYTT
ncbi:unnamed protein product [Cylicocyclus nassatus]|uniref:Uncharacterized protein n=1 Tax=Cylicocyclus nassatus TaxID=53992 RepID=A0AA36M2Q7_CYLNA|nr:unnamed protein product [Cylicocyclus nassatus]